MSGLSLPLKNSALLKCIGTLLWKPESASPYPTAKTGHKKRRRELIAIRPIVSHLYGYWELPLGLWSCWSSHSQDAISLTGAAVDSSGNYLLTRPVSLQWQCCWVSLVGGKGPFPSAESSVASGLGLCPSCDLFHVSYFSLSAGGKSGRVEVWNELLAVHWPANLLPSPRVDQQPYFKWKHFYKFPNGLNCVYLWLSWADDCSLKYSLRWRAVDEWALLEWERKGNVIVALPLRGVCLSIFLCGNGVR